MPSSSDCPFCPGPEQAWGMGPEGWAEMRRRHRAHYIIPSPGDDLDALLVERMSDPGFRRAFEDAVLNAESDGD